jgi:hypothetical protein
MVAPESSVQEANVRRLFMGSRSFLEVPGGSPIAFRENQGATPITTAYDALVPTAMATVAG